ncbi:MAG: hypothetical protein COZ51_02430 [Candidatus Aquicultor secundus]|nr:MAG: hypothetical protein COZ51_02430 [Candidatus Aquicultor secundus]
MVAATPEAVVFANDSLNIASASMALFKNCFTKASSRLDSLEDSSAGIWKDRRSSIASRPRLSRLARLFVRGENMGLVFWAIVPVGEASSFFLSAESEMR